MTKPVINHGRYVPALINFLGNKLSAGASSAYRREFGVGITEWRILSLLASEDACTAQQICQFFDLDKGLVSRTLKSLVDNGSVTVNADPGGENRRIVLLTRSGRALHDRIIELALDRERVLLNCLDEKEIEALIDMLGRLLAQAPAVNAVQVRKPASPRRKTAV
ncbi:MarR family transcriptional regulator [Tardiphaga sp. OK246]|uniref:MarR family winged helix-turn-helix transcriptional regulator n=1 Tax=Tardiphaga sp. OK246 TaxID=1855307 RepID=UPI000B7882C2|nr:MarR family transcriptional regulator [Tardiphaga sp. OK246]